MSFEDPIAHTPLYERKTKSGFTLREIPTEVYLAIALTALLMLASWALAHPFGAKARLQALEQEAAVVKSASLAEGDLKTYPVGSVCTGELDDTFKNRLTSALMNAGLKVDSLDIAQKGKVGEAHPLMAYGLTLKGSGTYEQAVSVMELLAHEKPKLFLDSLVLRNQKVSVDLNVEGRLYCRWTKQD